MIRVRKYKETQENKVRINMMLTVNYLSALAVAGLAGLLIGVIRMIYNVFFHPLANFPGPILWRASRLPYLYYMVRGDLTFKLLPLHEKYGSVLRVSPDELSFTHPDAWKDIYGHRVGANKAVPELPKSARFYRTEGTLPNIISEKDRDVHTTLRRLLSHGLSEQRLREREQVIVRYADRLVSQIRKHGLTDGSDGPTPRPMNMTLWYNLATVDVISELTFSEESACLENAIDDPWIRAMNGTVTNFIPLQVARHLSLEGPLTSLIRAFFNKRRMKHREVSMEKIKRRLEIDVESVDLVETILRKKDEWGIRDDAILGNSAALLIAGSETTATLLAGMTYILCKHPEALKKLTEEIRSSFSSNNEITMSSVLDLKYLLACLDEAMRYYPPVPIGPLRTVPKPGVTIAGNFVPEGTDVAVWHYPMFHHSDHWESPMEYRPERFLKENSPAFAGDMRYMKRASPESDEVDRLELLQPFNVGPRNCLGRNLAYAEMRLILSRMIFNFDMELVNPDQDWIREQQANFLWKKGPLEVYLTPVTEEL
ncbi:MAG: hypothetical protein M1821_009947 [Bathelium mastoideum]|nr:MAG: hypothetical protein M1821_009947 [Bathelium mastoideum]